MEAEDKSSGAARALELTDRSDIHRNVMVTMWFSSGSIVTATIVKFVWKEMTKEQRWFTDDSCDDDDVVSELNILVAQIGAAGGHDVPTYANTT
uniref:Uncharacterized protein n=1 Tax=Oryza rufipogon TaxID=4529 RepID=A0A0E0P5J3_ORYRU